MSIEPTLQHSWAPLIPAKWGEVASRSSSEQTVARPELSVQPEQTIEQVTAQCYTRHRIDPQSLSFDPEAKEQLKEWGIEKLIGDPRAVVLDKDGNGNISLTELDLTGDKWRTKKELEFLMLQDPAKLMTPCSELLQSPPEPLPNAEATGPPLVEVNNSETNVREGLQGEFTVPLEKGKCRLYSYGNTGRQPLQGENVGSDLRGKPVQQVFVFPNRTGKTLHFHVKGSSFNNAQADPSAPAGLGSNKTNQADFKLSQAMVMDKHQLDGEQVIVVKPGESLVIPSDVPATASDFRNFYEVSVEETDLASLDVQVGMYKPRPNQPNYLTGIGSLTQEQLAPVQAVFSKYAASHNPSLKTMEAGDNPALAALSNQKLKNAAPLEDPKALVRMLQDEWLPKLDRQAAFDPYLSKAEISQWRSRLEGLTNELAESGQITSDFLERLNLWNADIKMSILVLDAKREAISSSKNPDKALTTRLSLYTEKLWDLPLPLGRVIGVKPDSEIHSKIPVKLTGASYERNFTLVTNPFNTAGSNAADALPVSSSGENVKSPPPKGYGQYGVRYEIETTIENQTSTKQKMDIRFGTPDERGGTDWVSLFDSYEGYMGTGQKRFTGIISISIDGGDPEYIEIIHGKVHLPQSLKQLYLEPGQQRKVKIEFVVPTNNTGPHLLQLKAEQA